MALNDAERQQVLSAVSDVLTKDIHDELMEFYAVAVSVTERHPEQVNNEIRNAITHLSRALLAETLVEATKDITAASSHVARAKRDTLKMIILELHDRIQMACGEVKVFQGSIPPAFLLRRNALTEKRRQVLVGEIKGASNTMDGFVELYLEADELHTDLLSNFNLTSKRVNRALIWLASLFQGVSGIFWACVAGVIVFVLCSYIWPDAQGLGNWLRHTTHLPEVHSEPAKPSAANNPSILGKPGAPAPHQPSGDSDRH